MTNTTSRTFAMALLCASLGLAACGQAEPDAMAEVDAAAADPSAPKPTTETSPGAVALVSLSDLEARGKRLYLRCAACHSVTAADGHKVGPHLEGIVGREIGSAAGYNYSEQLREADTVWNEEMLDQFMAEPRAVFSKTTMVFAGINREEDRAALVAYLQTF